MAATEFLLMTRVSYRGQEITGPRLRGLFALLATDLRTGCSTGRLIDGLWPEEQPENPAKALQILVSRARAQFGQDLIARTPTGYRLALDDDQVDAQAVLAAMTLCAQRARAGEHEAALALAEEGLAHWDGKPAGDPEGDPLDVLRADRAATYRSLARASALALARLGRHAEAVEPLVQVAVERPHDEEVLLELLKSEAATAGQAAALTRYEQYRRTLRDELGSDPGTALQALHQDLLQEQTPSVRRGVLEEPNPLLGRDSDVVAVTALLRTARVVSIVGPGGLGKTRLAHAVSRVAEFPVVHFVGLAGVSRDAEVAAEVASAVATGDFSRVPADAVSQIASAFGHRPALLVLDNCEHVVRGAAELVRALVAACRDLRVLTTSRAPLGLSSESVYPLPELDIRTTTELFVQRAAAARPGAELPQDVVAELCRHLDGLPLAVELAAARVRVMSAAEIARGLDDRFSLLRGGSRDAPERHRTLQAVVEWSWQLLDPEAQQAMRLLSIFPGGFATDAAAHLVDVGVLEELVDQSLLKVTDTSFGARFRMLETVREFSATAWDEAGETRQAIDGMLAWAREFGLAHHGGVFGTDPGRAVELCKIEQDNLMQALRHGLAVESGEAVAAATAVLGGLWLVEANFTRTVTLMDDTGPLLSHLRPGPDFEDVVRTALTLATTYGFILRGPRASRSLVALRRLPAEPPDTLVRAIAAVVRDLPELAAADGAALRALCDSDQPLLAGCANGMACFIAEAAGDLDGALNAAKRMQAAFERVGGPWVVSISHARIAELCMSAGDGEQAHRHLEHALRAIEPLSHLPEPLGLRWGLVLTSLQRASLDDLEYWLARVDADNVPDTDVNYSFGIAIRAERLLLRGEVEEGLKLWRQCVDSLEHADYVTFSADRTMDPWALEVRAVAVVAHALHGRTQDVAGVIAELPATLLKMLREPVEMPSPSLNEFRVSGTVLLALALVDIAEGRRESARLVALAEKFPYLRNFGLTMSDERIRQVALDADARAYTDAVSEYARLDRDGVRAAALSALG